MITPPSPSQPSHDSPADSPAPASRMAGKIMVSKPKMKMPEAKFPSNVRISSLRNGAGWGHGWPVTGGWLVSPVGLG